MIQNTSYLMLTSLLWSCTMVLLGTDSTSAGYLSLGLNDQHGGCTSAGTDIRQAELDDSSVEIPDWLASSDGAAHVQHCRSLEHRDTCGRLPAGPAWHPAGSVGRSIAEGRKPGARLAGALVVAQTPTRQGSSPWRRTTTSGKCGNRAAKFELRDLGLRHIGSLGEFGLRDTQLGSAVVYRLSQVESHTARCAAPRSAGCPRGMPVRPARWCCCPYWVSALEEPKEVCVELVLVGVGDAVGAPG